MARRRSRSEINIMANPAFLDAMANTIGALIFMLLMVAVVTGAIKLNKTRLEILPRTNAGAVKDLPPAVVGQPYHYTLSAIGGNQPYQWSVMQAKLPDGLSIETLPIDQVSEDPEHPGEILKGTTAVVSGVPKKATATPTTFSVGVRNTAIRNEKTGGVKQKHDEVEARFALNVLPPAGKQARLHVLTTAVPPACFAKEYSLNPAASGGSPPFKWSVEGNLPPGLNVTGDKLTGTPTEPFSSTAFSLVVTDQDGNADKSVPLTLKVLGCETGPLPPPVPVKIVTGSLPDAVAGKSYEIALAANGGDGHYAWSVSGEPHGMAASSDGRISWTALPDAARHEFTLAVTVHSGLGSDSRQLKLSVAPGTTTLKMF